MTDAEAFAYAVRLWGATATLQRWQVEWPVEADLDPQWISLDGETVRRDGFRVGVALGEARFPPPPGVFGQCVYPDEGGMYVWRGQGWSWEEAFANAEKHYG
jgi:hypothetical protein